MEQCDPRLIDYKGQSQNDQGKKHCPARNKSAGRTKKKTVIRGMVMRKISARLDQGGERDPIMFGFYFKYYEKPMLWFRQI